MKKPKTHPRSHDFGCCRPQEHPGKCDVVWTKGDVNRETKRMAKEEKAGVAFMENNTKVSREKFMSIYDEPVVVIRHPFVPNAELIRKSFEDHPLFPSMGDPLHELKALRKVRDAAKRYMDVQYPCNCGELSPGPCCEECQYERELRETLAEMEPK